MVCRTDRPQRGHEIERELLMSEKFDAEKPLFRFIDEGEGGEKREYFQVKDLGKVYNHEDLEEIDDGDESEHS